MQKGKIGVTTDNIFPVIKKFLYSDHEIFLRELVSNAVDASQKLRTLSSVGEFKGELGKLEVRVEIDKKAGTLTISDNGVGMTADDIEKYINQIAFSGAEEFINKYKDNANAIIGHFGLGFYSAFMVSKKVEIITKSYKDGARAVKWSCDGSPEFEMEETDKISRGTDIILYIDDENKEYLEKSKIDTLLKKYCKFLPIPVISGKVQEWKDGKYIDTEQDNVINSVLPLWTKKPSELSDKDYIDFYHELNPGNDDPLFWIHLNVDYPFTLTGILYFPKIKTNFDINKNKIQLYCNQVFVTDSVEGVVPEFLTLLQGVIDSPDIPLNVSRSYLQSDSNVKKISSHITKKVASRLEEISKGTPDEFQNKWNDISLFIEYGMLTDEKFCDSAMKFALLEDTDNKYYKIDDYKKLISGTQTDKEGNIIVLYATDKETQYSYINDAIERGYNVLLMNGQLDSHFIGLLENKLEKCRFVRVDSDVVDNLIIKDNIKENGLSQIERNILTNLFKSQLPEIDKTEFMVTFQPMSDSAAPIVITQNEYMRRMKDMASMQPGMNFYSEMPDSFNLTLNTNHKIIKNILSDSKQALEYKVEAYEKIINESNTIISELNNLKKNDKDLSAEDSKKLSENESLVESTRKDEYNLVSEYAATVPKIKQVIDLALLGNGMLKGADLNAFLKRSIQLL